jgi:hypothetical protein
LVCEQIRSSFCLFVGQKYYEVWSENKDNKKKHEQSIIVCFSKSALFQKHNTLLTLLDRTGGKGEVFFVVLFFSFLSNDYVLFFFFLQLLPSKNKRTSMV